MRQTEGDLLVHIVQGNYRFSTNSAYVFPQNSSVIVFPVFTVSHFFIIVLRFVYFEKLNWGKRQVSACLTHSLL